MSVWSVQFSSVQFSSVQDGVHALGKAHNYALHLVSQECVCAVYVCASGSLCAVCDIDFDLFQLFVTMYNMQCRDVFMFVMFLFAAKRISPTGTIKSFTQCCP